MNELEPVQIRLLSLVELGDHFPALRFPLFINDARLSPAYSPTGDIQRRRPLFRAFNRIPDHHGCYGDGCAVLLGQGVEGRCANDRLAVLQIRCGRERYPAKRKVGRSLVVEVQGRAGVEIMARGREVDHGGRGGGHCDGSSQSRELDK